MESIHEPQIKDKPLIKLPDTQFKTFDQLIEIDQKHPILVEVVNPQTIEDKSGKFTQFTVKGTDQEGKFQVERRYSDFYYLRQNLIQRWPGCYIPPIPSKKMFGNLENEFIEERRKFLSYFCLKLTEMKSIYYSDECKIFFKSKSSDIESLITQLPKLSTGDIVNRYRYTFTFLSGALQNLENMKKISIQLQQAKQNYCDQFSFVTQTVLPEYEKKVTENLISEQEKHLLVFSSNPQVIQQAKELQESQKVNTFSMLHEFINTETKEVKAFIEALSMKQKYEELKDKTQKKIDETKLELAKLQEGKTTFKSLITKGSKFELIDRHTKFIEETQKELDDIALLIDLITLILGYIEIDKFKVEKQKKYYDALIKMSINETTLNQKYVSLWGNVEQVFKEQKE